MGTAASADALISWWSLAGVDAAISEAPVNWLRPASARPVAPVSPAASSAPSTPGPASAAEHYPDALPAFEHWLRESSNLPDAQWVGPRILPRGEQGAALMVVCDVPDAADLTAGALLSEEVGRLFDAMMAAIGQTRDTLYIAALAVTRPPGGILNDQDGAALASRMRHHIGLVAPRRLLLLGDKTARFLSPGPSQGIRSLNHSGGTVDAIATFHPRLLLRQPQAKAECWRALQHLIEVQP